MGADHRHLYVSNWGSRSVSVVDTKDNHRVRDIAVGLRPNDMIVAPDGRLFVACAGDNTVHVIQTSTVEKAARRQPQKRPSKPRARSSPPRSIPSRPKGARPTPWPSRPTARRSTSPTPTTTASPSSTSHDPGRIQRQGLHPDRLVSDRGRRHPRRQDALRRHRQGQPVPRQPVPRKPRSPTQRTRSGIPFPYIGTRCRGSVSIRRPSRRRDSCAPTPRRSTATAPTRRQAPHRARSPARPSFPTRSATRAPIKHVLYIIKENRTYDQVFGDIKDATASPRQRRPAPGACSARRSRPTTTSSPASSCCSTTSTATATSASTATPGATRMATDYKQRSWMPHLLQARRLARQRRDGRAPPPGYLWDVCQRHGVTYRNYGEGAKRVPIGSTAASWHRLGHRDMDRVEVLDRRPSRRRERPAPCRGSSS